LAVKAKLIQIAPARISQEIQQLPANSGIVDANSSFVARMARQMLSMGTRTDVLLEEFDSEDSE